MGQCHSAPHTAPSEPRHSGLTISKENLLSSFSKMLFIHSHVLLHLTFLYTPEWRKQKENDSALQTRNLRFTIKCFLQTCSVSDHKSTTQCCSQLSNLTPSSQRQQGAGSGEKHSAHLHIQNT